MKETGPLPPEIQKEVLFAECTEKSWELFVQQFSRLHGKRGAELQHEVNRNIPVMKRLFLNWKDKLELQAKAWRTQEPRLRNDAEARIAVMTANALYFQVMKALGEDKDLTPEYIQFMEALRNLLPWNATGASSPSFEIPSLEKTKLFLEGKLE